MWHSAATVCAGELQPKTLHGSSSLCPQHLGERGVSENKDERRKSYRAEINRTETRNAVKQRDGSSERSIEWAEFLAKVTQKTKKTESLNQSCAHGHPELSKGQAPGALTRATRTPTAQRGCPVSVPPLLLLLASCQCAPGGDRGRLSTQDPATHTGDPDGAADAGFCLAQVGLFKEFRRKRVCSSLSLSVSLSLCLSSYFLASQINKLKHFLNIS